MRIMLANFTKMVDDNGGMAKVTCAMANEFVRRGHEVALVYSDEKEGKFFFPVCAEVKCFDLRHLRGESIKFPLTLKLKREVLRIFNMRMGRTVNNEFAEKYLLKNAEKIIKQFNPDVIVSYQPAASKLLLCDIGTTVPVITMSHGDPEDYFQFYPKKEIPALTLSAVNQVLLPSFAEHLVSHLPSAKTIVIGNAVPQYECQADLSKQKDTYTIITVGRLNKNHKRPHLLIKAFAQLAQEFPHWVLELWGADDGKAYRKELELLIKTLGMEKRVFLKGATNDVPSVLSQADIFAFPSAYEGFSLALTEAMSMGLPAVGFKNCPSVNELIVDGVNGFLCADGVETFAASLKKLMANRELRVTIGKRARNSMKLYSPESIWDEWESLLNIVTIKRE